MHESLRYTCGWRLQAGMVQLKAFVLLPFEEVVKVFHGLSLSKKKLGYII